MKQPLLITVATQNQHKLREMEQYIEHLQSEDGVNLQLVVTPENKDVEETGQTFLENALIKAKAALPAEESRYILAEDSGFVIPALAGQYELPRFPGIHSNRWLTTDRAEELDTDDKNTAILKLMEGQEDRSAYYICAMVLYAPKQGLIFQTEGTMPLSLIEDNQPRGTGGFGYDPIVHPVIDAVVDARTVAELSATEKNQLSHRGKALQTLVQFLKLYPVS